MQRLLNMDYGACEGGGGPSAGGDLIGLIGKNPLNRGMSTVHTKTEKQQ